MPPREGLCTVPLQQLAFDRRLALLFGSEAQGVSARALECVDGAFSVALQGLTESLNVSVCVACAAHLGALERRRLLGLQEDQGDLKPEELQELLASYAERSAERRFAARLRAERAQQSRGAGGLPVS